MLKVLLPTIERPVPGGVARYIAALAETFPGEVSLLCLTTNEQGRVSYRKIFNEICWRPRSRVKQLWINYLLPIGTVAWLCSFFGSFFGGTPYTIFLHGLDFDLARRTTWKRWLSRQILGRAKHTVTNSQALADEAHAFAPRSPQALVVYPVVSETLLKRAAELAVAITPPASGAVRGGNLLTVARLVARKGHLKVLEALVDLPGVNYVIAGEGPERAAIETAVRRLGLADRVRLLGDVADEALPDIYRSADIFVMPTTKTKDDREGFGTVYLEAQLFGLPVIATKQPGVDEAIADGQTGLLIEDTPQALLAGIKRALTDQTFRSSCRLNGPKRIRETFVKQVQMKKLEPYLV